uniref:helix-turn-helix domain-containing protein n=1 Tax=Streptomyces spectabilis TaxID=68270 RepID=UPI0035E0FE34
MTETALDELVDQLSQKLDELRERERSQQRGGDRIRARGAGAKDKLTTADRVLATVLYLRKLRTRDLIAQLLGVNGSTITRAVHQIQPSSPTTAAPFDPQQPGSAHPPTSPRSSRTATPQRSSQHVDSLRAPTGERAAVGQSTQTALTRQVAKSSRRRWCPTSPTAGGFSASHRRNNSSCRSAGARRRFV